jgi:hypothetical protein
LEPTKALFNLMMNLADFAKYTLNKVLEDQKHQDLYSKLVFRQSSFKDVEKVTFMKEYLALQLALVTKVWPICCEENSLKTEQGDKFFLRVTLTCFESEKMKELAVAYGEYLYAKENAESGEIVLRMVEKFFERLKMQTRVQRGTAEALMSPAFQLLIENLDGYRMSFENEFLETVFEDLS